ncbi:SET domain-containing protein SmydA-8-like [Teleopsis dalmanni]|uniref:SET domain-containing protein SmydA-8-like n=1 Tax=Teleopsis dalmanni TaxID=139649 RepID=UPI0018CE5031|nr:SET domain-containing protein SmydA-8-like [Teleopsis dalmanni]
MAAPAELQRLVKLHLGELQDETTNWTIAESPVAGRGVFASRDIAAGEVLFRERALVIGPTARKGSILNTCICCHKLLAVKEFLCKNKCTLPVCDSCADSDAHRNECELFNRWQPKEYTAEEGSICNPMSLRILTAIRVFYLNSEQRALINAMQANPDRGYRQEIIKAAQSFRKFPTTDKKFMDNLFRVVGVLNTNSFEAPCRVGPHEILVRGLFPLTAVMNHECTPNASHYFDNGQVATVRAARFIPKGTEITTTYTKILWSNLTRNIFLRMTKHFECNCYRCNDNTVSEKIIAKYSL